MFQSTPPRGGRFVHFHNHHLKCFNPPRVVGCLALFCSIVSPPRVAQNPHKALIIGFNPRPRVGATLVAIYSKTCRVVSIHAPAWGRRNRPLYERALSGFNRPACGRHARHISLRDIICFNPRPRVGEF